MSDFGDRLLADVRAVALRRDYAHSLKRLRRAVAERKLKVVFCVAETAKWKGDSLFRELARSERFEPVIAVMNLTRQADDPLDEQRRALDEKLRFFGNRGMAAVNVQRLGRRDVADIDEVGADIVFYQQPWDLPPQLKPTRVARRALTFYFPYYTPNYSDTEIEIDHKLHHQVFGHVVCDESTARFYRSERRRMTGAYAGDYLPLGHPALDEISFEPDPPSADGCVIYAPHWSVGFGDKTPPVPLSTFVETGRAMLDYARAHPDVKWAFKPHPLLRSTLVDTGFMTEAETAAYYAEWDRLGETCLDGNYLGLFARSRAMVTDCGSFLTEYGCTGKPVIRLVNPQLRIGVQPFVGELYSKYYNVVTAGELSAALEMVVARGEDPRRGERLGCLKSANLLGGRAARRIADYLDALVGPPDGRFR